MGSFQTLGRGGDPSTARSKTGPQRTTVEQLHRIAYSNSVSEEMNRVSTQMKNSEPGCYLVQLSQRKPRMKIRRGTRPPFIYLPQSFPGSSGGMCLPTHQGKTKKKNTRHRK